MATLTPTLTLVSTDLTADSLSLSVTDSLTVTSPYLGISRATVSATGANNIIQPQTDGQTYYMYIKHTGTSVGKLAAGEFAFFPSGGHSLGVQLQASSGTIVAEYAYFTKG